jgi:hypothetical protein
MTEERIRIEIGFDGGQIMSAFVQMSDADRLEQLVATGHESGFMFEAEDGRYTVALRRVVYVKRFAREGRVGFGMLAPAAAEKP